MNLAVVSSFPPKICGIGEFCYDMVTSLQQLPNAPQIAVYAIDNNTEGYLYQSFVINHFYYLDSSMYSQTAYTINMSNADICLLQHEFNLFGGKENQYILDFVQALEKPLVVVLHNIPSDPQHPAYASRTHHLKEIAKKAHKFITTTHFGRKRLIELGTNPSKIEVIVHGAPAMPPRSESSSLKKKFGLENHFVVTEFGIMHPRKNVELLLNAIAEGKTHIPNLLCLVVGTLAQDCIVPYIDNLKAFVKTRGIEQNVRFVDTFLNRDQLTTYIVASDVVVTPYSRVDQISSGQLTFAVAAGTPVISTEYLYAKDLLKDIGLFIPFNDSNMLVQLLTRLANDTEFYQSQQAKTQELGKTLAWKDKAAEYLKVFEKLLNPKLE